MTYFIYALAHHRTDEVVYVGITDNIRKRFREHVACKDTNAEKNAWIQQLLRETLVPSLKILETVGTLEEARKCEASWIQHCLSLGKLLNVQEPDYSPQKQRYQSPVYTAAKQRKLEALQETQRKASLIPERQAAEVLRLSIDDFREMVIKYHIDYTPVGWTVSTGGIKYEAKDEPLFILGAIEKLKRKLEAS